MKQEDIKIILEGLHKETLKEDFTTDVLYKEIWGKLRQTVIDFQNKYKAKMGFMPDRKIIAKALQHLIKAINHSKFSK